MLGGALKVALGRANTKVKYLQSKIFVLNRL